MDERRWMILTVRTVLFTVVSPMRRRAHWYCRQS